MQAKPRKKLSNEMLPVLTEHCCFMYRLKLKIIMKICSIKYLLICQKCFAEHSVPIL